MGWNAVFLCDHNWIIQSFMRLPSDLTLHTGEQLTQLIDQAEQLREDFGLRRRSTWTFPGLHITAQALIKAFPEGYLVLLFRAETGESSIEIAELYEDAIEWARDHFQGLFHNEYYQIQQLNNQLIDSKRALARSNSKLHQALEEMEQTNRELEIAQAAVQKALKLAEQANRSKTAFLASVSHDIRTPMNAIVGFIHLMEHEKDLSEKQREYLQKMRFSSQHLLSLINDVLDISKIESGGIVLNPMPLSITDQIHQVDAVIRPQAVAKQQTFCVKMGKLSHDRFLGDGVRLRQVFMNLLSNAVKYTPCGGRIQLEISENSGRRPGYAALRFAVSDNGCGMEPEFAKHVFEPFTREGRAIEKGVQGTGLGMAITKNIVDLMEGQITVVSKADQGSCFTVTLELPKDDSALEASGIDSSAEKSKNHVLQGKHFLCAEDNELNSELLKALLELSGAACKIYPNGKELVQAFVNVSPGEFDAILMDVQMPVMDGLAAAKAIRKSGNPLGKNIPIIAMTANAFSEDIQNCLDAGMNAHIAKPLEIAALERVMQNLGTANTALERC